MELIKLGIAAAAGASIAYVLLTRRGSRIHKLQVAAAPKPLVKYVNAVAANVRGSATFLHVSGQLGCDADGRFADTAEAQCDLAFGNVHACLREAGMDWSNLVKVTVFLSARAHLAGYRSARDRALGDMKVGSTLVISDLVAEHVLAEIEALAVK